MSKNVIFYFDRLGFVGHFKPMRITRIPSQIEEMFCRLNTPITLLSVRSQYFLYCWQCESQHPPLIPSSPTNPPPPPKKKTPGLATFQSRKECNFFSAWFSFQKQLFVINQQLVEIKTQLLRRYQTMTV